MAPQPKTLRQHVWDRTFIPKRHEQLLAADRSLETATPPDHEQDYWVRLFELQLYYQGEARNAQERRGVALAFRDAIDKRYERYNSYLRDHHFRQVDGEWELEPITRQMRQAAKRRQEERAAEFLRELWRGMIDLSRSEASEDEHVAWVRNFATSEGFDPDEACRHVSAALRRMDATARGGSGG
jgi:hypothetical protein